MTSLVDLDDGVRGEGGPAVLRNAVQKRPDGKRGVERGDENEQRLQLVAHALQPVVGMYEGEPFPEKEDIQPRRNADDRRSLQRRE